MVHAQRPCTNPQCGADAVAECPGCFAWYCADCLRRALHPPPEPPRRRRAG